MRKKISNILMGILLIFAGVFVSACGDKYKNFEFKISYAFSENAETWYDAKNGINLNYSLDEETNEYVFSINGNEERIPKGDFNIYLKAEVNNVKSKHLDSITISAQGASGLAFSSSTIKPGKTIKLPVVGLVNSQISLYENKSGRSTKINLSVYGKIENITRNDLITPAIVTDGTLDLNSIRDLIIYNKDGITTNQTGVSYEIVDFGKFTNSGSYQVDTLSNNQLNRQFLSLTNGKLKLNQKIGVGANEKKFVITENNNVIRIKATSIYSPTDPTIDNPAISTDVYVYIVGGNLISPVVAFEGTEIDVNSSDLKQKGLDLYFNSGKEASLNKYANSIVKVTGINGVYKEGVYTVDGKLLKYKVKAYIGNSNNNSYVPYEFGSDVPIRNLKISENDNIYTITLVNQSSEKFVDVKFAYELVCEKDENTYPVTFTSVKPVLETNVEVRKHILASSIIVNGQEYRNETLNGVVYSTSHEKYAGYKAELAIEPLDPNNPQTIEISGIENLNILNKKGFKVKEGDKFANGEILNIKFATGVYNNQTACFKVLKTPTYYNGQDVANSEYVFVNLELTRKVTADALEFVDGNNLSNQISTANVARSKTSYVFIKAYHSGSLDRETISLSSDACVLNGNGDKKILLNAENVTTNLDWNGDGYTIFRVAIPATQGVDVSKLTVYAGEFGNGASNILTLSAVDLITNPENIKILPKNNINVTSFNDNKFAIIKGKDVTFNVVEFIDGKNIENTIHKVTLTGKEITGANAEYFGDAEVLTKTEFGDNTFNIHGWNPKTRIFDVNVQYYSQNAIGVVSLYTKTIRNVQFAVYNPITSISITATKERIAYVNSLYIEEASTTELSYTSYSGVSSEMPTKTVYFLNHDGSLDNITGKNATNVNIFTNSALSSSEQLFYSTGTTYNELKNLETENNIIWLNKNVANAGKIKIQLINNTSLKNIKLAVVANSFGQETTVTNDLNVVIASVEKAQGIDVTRGDIIEYSQENKELQLSFMGITAGLVSKEFAVKPVYKNAVPDINTLQFKDLNWELYKYDYVDGILQYNEQGKIKLKQITNFTNSLNIVNNNGEFNVIADKSKTGIGGLYKLVIATKDSYQTATGKYDIEWSINIRVSDGKTSDSAYVLTSYKDFEKVEGLDITKIDTDLDAYYVLGNNITIPADVLDKPIGYADSSAAAFTGVFSGRLQTFTDNGDLSLFNFNLNVTIGNGYIETTGDYKNVYGLFSILEGTISNLNINITYSTDILTNGISTMGGIVAVNKGVIKNVNVTVTGANITINNATNFGGIVGVNEGEISNCVIDSSQGLIINANVASNIGGIVGENKGIITGQYKDKSDLNRIKYDNIVNITINNNADNIAYNIGSVAGASSMDITNMLVGGKIIVISEKADHSARPMNGGYLAGIVGSTSANVSTVAAVGLDLINAGKNGINVAGIAGNAKDIENSKFVSVLAKFANFTAKGELVGKTVAGISLNANVNYSSVESFIKTVNGSTFYTFEGATVYGLIKEGSLRNSFISANINATTAFLTSANENKNATYFIGKVNGTPTINSTYAVVYDNTDFVKISGFTFDENNYNNHIETTEPISLKESWLTEISKLTDFAVNSGYNIVNISKYQGIDFYFPYIYVTLEDGSTEPLMILQPSSIKAEINQDYQIDIEENIYVGDADIKDDETNPTYEIKESIVVDFFENNYDNYGNLDVNKHKLVNDGTDDGLIDLTMLPANATAGLTFELVANYGDIARIEGNTYLILTGASSLKPIILRAYSMFNPEAEAYFAIYSQRTFSELILEGNTVTKLDEQDYVVNVYQGRNSTIALKADNIKEGVSYDSILTNNSHLVKVVATGYDETKIDINSKNLSSIIVKIKEGYVVTGKNESVNVTLKVLLDQSYFSGFNNDLELGTIKLSVNLNDVATKLDIVGANDFEIDSSSTLNFEANLKTGFVNDIQHQECSVEVDDNGVVIVDKNHVDIKDSIRMNIYSTNDELIRIKTETGANSFAELFNYDIYETKNADGYNYEVSLALKDEFNFRYVTSNIDLVVNIWAASNPNVMNAVNVTIKPTTANTTRLSSYNVEGVNVVSNTKSELTLGQVESSIISPGGRGNMLLAYVEKSYSNIDSISITSSDLFVPELNKNVNLVFTQYVYNKSTRKFETLFNSNVQAQNGKTLELQKVTTIENGKTEYTGILYIHAQLIKVSGLEARISATLNVVSNGISIPATTVDMLTTFLPGASLTYSGIQADNGGYLVQESTYGNTARIKLYGYQFNSNPTMIVDWELIDGVDYFYKLNEDKNIQIDLSVITDANADGSTDDEKIAKLKDYFDKGTLYYSIGGKYYKATEESHYKTLTNTFYSIEYKKLIEKAGVTYNIADYVSTYFLKQYDKVDYNPVDGSYSMDVLFNIAKDIPANFSLQASMSLITSDGQFENSASEKIMFYPTKYVVTGVSVKDTAGNKKMLAINRTDKIQLLFNTLRGDYDFSAAIYDEFFIKHIADLKELFKYFDITEKTFKDANSAFNVDFKNNYLSITGLSTFEKEITLSVYVGYEFKNGKYEIVFGEQGASNVSLLTYSFTLQIYPGEKEENAIPIYSASDMVDESGNSRLASNGHYILMNDITLDLVKPIENIASLDGNNHIIKIKNFVIDPSKTEYGLFANIGTYQDEEGRTHKSILKNVVVDYSDFNVENSGNIEFINNNMTTIKFGGLVATNNGGLIYNCDVINSVASRDKVINIHVDENASITFGGLVASNLGVITNSRVGRREFKDVDAVNDTYVNTTFGGLEFVLGSETKSGFDAVAGGFVGENSGTISSSYFANSSLVNYSNSNETNITAGFAGKNNSSASIVYSYVKAKETTITSVQPYATGARIENKSNGIVSGFVYENAGTITDSYANTELYTDSTYMSGFVYENLSGGEIVRSYAACTMKKESGEAQNNAQQPFVGKNNENKYLNAGTMENNYYLLDADGSGDIRETFALALNATNFKNPNNLQGFVFIQSNVKEEREQGVWSHIDTKGNALILPELMNANVIATSAKYLLSDAKDENGITKYTYTNASSVTEGTQYNPYIIRNVQEFNDTLTGNRDDMSDHTSKSGYIRLIDSINFGEDGDAIKTRINYTLGNEYRANLTSFEGNGLKIEGIYFDNPQTQTNEMGLFGKIENAYVKNVNLSFVTPKNGVQYGTTNVKYSGGLAGIVTNSAIININLDGSDVSLTGQNYVGGVAGMVNGDSLLYGITSNLSVSADSAETGLYYSEKDYIDLGNYNHAQHISNLSYAGGIAGVIDVTKRAGTDYNVSYIDVYGDQMFVKATEQQLPNIEGQYAGGIAGFAGSNVSALKLKYHTGASDWISGSEAAGGIFAVSLGKIMASQVTAVEDTQFEYDTEFGKYVLDVEKGLDETKVGNLNLIESNGYAGGLIGIGLYAGVDASYAKAGFRNGKVIGGLIGLSVASKVTYSYAVPFVNLTEKTKEIGGLIGSAHMVEKGFNYNLDPLGKYKELVKVYLNRDTASSSIAYTDIQYTFSTVLVEKSLLSKNGINREDLANSPIQIGYLVPNVINGSNVNAIRSGGNTAYLGVYEGRLEDYSYTIEGTEKVDPIYSTEKSKEAKLKVIFDLTHTSQETTFNEIFSPWKVISYWSLNNEKYFPLLINDYVDNYTLIKDATDLLNIASNPNGKFKVIQDIDMSAINGNWVIAETFTGELIGEIDSETQERKKIKNITLTPNDANQSSGFFKATKGAIISDLEFVWNDAGNEDDGAINSSVNLTDVSGLSCFDEYAEDGENSKFSEFNNVEVRVSGGGYLIKPGASNITINKFGGIVASTQNSLMIGCDFVGKVDVILSKDTDPNNINNDNNKNAYFGGLIGKAEKVDNTGSEVVENSSMSIMNSKVGANGENTSKPETEFTIAVNGATQAYIGGAIGHITNASVLGVSVGSVKYTNEDYQTIKMTINVANTNENDSSQNIAGLVGYCNDKSSLVGSDVDVSITVSGGSADTDKNYSSNIAGLIATYNGKMYIANSNSKANIDVSEFETDTLLVAGGVASLSSEYSEDVISQCLFTGSIIGEKEEEHEGVVTAYQTNASYIYAGGAIAKTNSSVKISETMTTVDVTIGSTNLLTELYAGGFVGNVSGNGSTLTLNNVVSSGKLVPFCGKDTKKVHLGGMIGSVDPKIENAKGETIKNACAATITNSYTVTSIIADAIAGKALPNTSSDALVGYAVEGKVQTTNVYYSTDFALTSNDHNYGNNIAGSDFVYSSKSIWKDRFVNAKSSMWKYLSGVNDSLPLIKSIEDSLKIYKVLQIDSGKDNYILGSSLRPLTSVSEFKTEFTYYIIDSANSITGTLNGVLIGEDVELTTNDGNLITTIGKHSAVSNIHLNIVSSESITLAGGFIVNENNGLIFNCSVQGKGINISGYAGVIAGANNGTISYSYSGIEITNVSSASGIVYTNNSVINSCYFTGYINSGAASAGIMLEVSPEQTENVYVYNNYMAGVITGISTTNPETSFFAGNIADFDGKNNYIDQFANNELEISVSYQEGPVGSETTINVLQSVSTAELMSRIGAGYAGSWYTTVNDKFDEEGNFLGKDIDTATVEEDKTINGTFGYNYGYPIYKFKKLSTNVIADELKCSDIEYSLYTGTGEDDSEDLTSRYTNIHGSLYENAYKIPHLGVMTALHALQGESRNYVVIYDLTGKASRKDDGKMLEWNGICSTSEINEEFASTGAFKGVLVTNKNLKPTEITAGAHICKIEGLNKSGLFNEIGVSYIADIILASFGEDVPAVDDNPGIQGITNSGAIGNTVLDKTTINNIKFADDSVIVGNNFGGLFGSVQSIVTITNFKSNKESDTNFAAITLQGSGSAGLIANILDSGVINLDPDETADPTNALHPYFKGVETAGGLVGTAIAGTINGHKNIIHINNNVTETIINYGGIVGSVPVGGNVAVNSIVVDFVSGAVITANSFGGFISKVAGMISFASCTINGSNLKINSEAEISGQKGLLVGEILETQNETTEHGNVTITKFVLTNGITLDVTGCKNNDSSIGGFIGTQNGHLSLEIETSNAITINSQNSQNLGGIIGIYNYGNINFTGVKPENITLNGCQNVGGFIGQAKAWPTIVDGATNFLKEGPYSKIKITKYAKENIGGLFGLLEAGNVDEDADLTAKTVEDVINKNTFEIIDNEEDTKTVANIGGVAGFINNKDAKLESLHNQSGIEASEKTKYIFKNIGGVTGKLNCESITNSTNSGELSFVVPIGNYDAVSNASINGTKASSEAYSIAVNVGGIIGLANNEGENAVEFTSLVNAGAISGYQNVGGLIGYANKIAFEENSSSTASGAIAGVINIGGAIGCVQESELQGISSIAKVYGNTNVGGLIGLSSNNTLKNNIVGGEIEPDYTQTDEFLNNTLTTIKAIYYNVYELESDPAEYVSYIPTGVGGLIGASQGTTIESNTVRNVRVISTDEGKETGEPNSESKGMISTISNFMANAGSGEGSDLTKVYLKSDYVALEEDAGNKQPFARLTSGFGGFIGTLDNTEKLSSDSTIRNLAIKAPLGINVGTYYGFYNHGKTFNAPNLDGKIYIDGAYNVGGIAGFASGDIGSVGESFDTSVITDGVTINLQNNLMGMYVGGMFGKLTAHNAYLSIIKDNIKINTQSSYYIGGLVGKLEVKQGNKFNGNIADTILVTKSNYDEIGSAQNFGGLVGMLKCVGDTGENKVYSVNGTHYYPFTVNTIENSNYAEGASQFDAEFVEDNVNLYAQANYINQDSFNISATKGDFYGLHEGSKIYKNPLNPDSWGWSKEYTGFKQIQRCIPQPGIWDSIAVVYNAEWITEVGTVGNLELYKNICENGCITEHEHSIIQKDSEGDLFYLKGGIQKFIDNEHIVYTIYKKNQDIEMMYSAIGIAEIAQFAGENVNNDDTDTSWYLSENLDDQFNNTTNTISEYYYARNINENYELMGWYQASNAAWTSDPGYEKKLYSVTDSIVNDARDLAGKNPTIRQPKKLDTSGLLYFNWNNNVEFVNRVDLGENKVDLDYKSDGTFKLHFYQSKRNKFYDFRVIYANNTLSSESLEEGYTYENLNNNLPDSGSVFEIYGLSPSLKKKEGVTEGSWWNKWGKWVLLVVEIALTVVGAGWAAHLGKVAKMGKAAKLTYKTWNATQHAYKGVKNAGKLASKAWAAGKKLGKLKKGIVALSIVSTTLLGSSIGTLIANLSSSYSSGVAGSRSLYYESKNQNFGLLTSTTTTEIKYKDNVMVGSLGSVVTKVENGEEYEFHFYSNVRPGDYYKNYYIIPKQSYEENKDLISQGYVDNIPYGDSRISKNGNKLYSFDFKYTDEDGEEQHTTAELKYIFHEGAYYANKNAMTVGKYRTQELSEPGLVAKTEAQAVYGADGIAYVLGKYSNGEYSFNDEPLNLVKDNGDGTYSLNNKPVNGEMKVDVEFIGVSQSAYEIVASKPGVVEGYDYLQNAYYTTKGSSTTDTNYIRYATFKYHGPEGSQDANWTVGVDYIVATYTLVENVGVSNSGDLYYMDGDNYCKLQDTNEDGVINNQDEHYSDAVYKLTQNQKAIFVIEKMETSGTQTSSSLGCVQSNALTNKKITLKAYPTSFKDPYNISIINSQDVNYYIHKSHSSGTGNPTFKFEVKYYYFEGGYMLWQDFAPKQAGETDPRPSIKDEKFTFIKEDNTTEIVTFDDSLQNSIYTRVDLDEMINSGYTGVVMLWGKIGSMTTEDFISVPLVGDNATDALILKNGNIYSINTKYLGCYVDPVEISSTEEYDIILKYSKRVDVNYILYKNSLWVKDDMYSLDEQGYVNKIYLYNNIKSKDADFVTNRYLTYNSEKEEGYKGVYTMFKYTNSDNLSMDLMFKEEIAKWIWEIDGKNYHIIPTNTNRTRPNSDASSTYLVESCKVVLGGGRTLNYTNGKNYDPNGPTSGTITIN